MKKNQKINVLLCIFLTVLHETQCISRSIFIPRSLTTDSSFELSLTNYHRYHNEVEKQVFYVDAKPFYMKSTNGRSLAQYFLPHCKSCIVLDEAGNGDVNPLWFNIIAPAGSMYTSIVSLNPKREVVGSLFTAYVTITDRIWAGFNTCAMIAKHNLNVCEFNRPYLGTIPGFATACDGFNNPAWCASMLSCQAQERAGLDDVQLKLAYDFYKETTDHATFYLVGTIPTRGSVHSRFLFGPWVGSNHGSLGIGFNADYSVYECANNYVNILADIKYRYVFAGIECRSFDLCANGDWSRYLLVVTQDQPLNSLPAINLLSLPVKVTPRNTIDLWLALHYQQCGINFEIGYDCWWRQSEKIKKCCCFSEVLAIQTLAICQPGFVCANTANISQGAAGPNATQNNPTFTPIKNCDLNLCSGSMPESMSQKIYLSGAYQIDNCSVSYLLGFGASYEFSIRNALSQWGVWINQALVF